MSETRRMTYFDRIARAVAALGLFLSMATASSAQQARVSIEPGEQNAARGGSVTIEVRLAASNLSIGGGAVFLRFPEARLRFLDGQNNLAVWNSGVLNVEPRLGEPGVVALSVGAGAPGVRGDGVLVATLHFLALSEGEAALALLQDSGTRETLFAGLDLAVVPTTVAGGRIVVSAATPGPTPVACAGDCSRDGEVTVDEIITGVRIALEEVPLAVCNSFDTDRSGGVSVDELIAAVGRALGGCS